MIPYRSRVNQPDRVFINSSDDTTIATSSTGNPQALGTYNSFQANYITPILGVKRVQLLRATIPNAPVNISIPPYALVFWYYKSASAFVAPNLNDLHCVRILPQNSVSQLTAYGVPSMRYLASPLDLVSLLNASAASADPVLANPYFIRNDVSFSFSSTTNQISMVGAQSGFYYAPVGYNDPIWQTAQAGNTLKIWGPTFTLDGVFTTYPMIPGYNLNVRCGYSLPGGIGTIATLTGKNYNYNTPIVPNSFPNIVYTQCIYLYANIIPGTSLGSGGQHNLLAVVPNNTATLGVIQYTVLMSNWLMKVASEIYEIKIDMYDDANYPFLLPDGAQVNLELAFYYRDD
jgi:hypothetical protein